ncbi:MAG: 4-(cytidine 5'-diphospho)-2-C-methyl-D-erythritol kinase [Treponema sp.]|nr:4-(cytidine 5'-diphospho)-2-C-methyl-D-erythritol kinase [Treponema sp.]
MQYFDEITVQSPAKVNLHLSVGNRRPDGFHDIESLFLAVEFGDTLYFRQYEGKNAGLQGFPANNPIDGLSIPDNIINRALDLFREKIGFSQSVGIRAEKRIPIGGGLGGGSSNAAATLLALNKMTGSPLNKETLLEMAASLGSDVPFFIHETPAAWVTGRGEFIEPVKMPQLFLVLVNPGFSSNTGTAFKLLDEYRRGSRRGAEAQREDEVLSSPLLLFSASSASPCLCVNEFMYRNDFLHVFPDSEKSIYTQIISQLKDLGAQFANLSGAGSTCFGIFENAKTAENAALTLREKWPFAVNCSSLI